MLPVTFFVTFFVYPRHMPVLYWEQERTLLGAGTHLTGSRNAPYWEQERTLLGAGTHLIGSRNVPYWEQERHSPVAGGSPQSWHPQPLTLSPPLLILGHHRQLPIRNSFKGIAGIA